MNLDEWNDDAAVEVSTQELDAEIAKYKELRDEYDVTSKAKTEAIKNKDKQEIVIMDLLKKAGKTKYLAEGIGTMSLSQKSSAKTAKTVEDKKKLFDWLKSLDDKDEYYWSYITVNSASLNALVKTQSEIYANRGEVLEVPGIEVTYNETTRFRKV